VSYRPKEFWEQRLAEQFDVRGTPSWRIAGQMISGFLPESEFERLAAIALPQPTAKAS